VNFPDSADNSCGHNVSMTVSQYLHY